MACIQHIISENNALCFAAEHAKKLKPQAVKRQFSVPVLIPGFHEVN